MSEAESRHESCIPKFNRLQSPNPLDGIARIGSDVLANVNWTECLICFHAGEATLGLISRYAECHFGCNAAG